MNDDIVIPAKLHEEVLQDVGPEPFSAIRLALERSKTQRINFPREAR